MNASEETDWGLQRLQGFLCSYPCPFPVVFCLQAGKKPVRAMLWVSADGLRVVDDKTKVIIGLQETQRVAFVSLKGEAAELQQPIMAVW